MAYQIQDRNYDFDINNYLSDGAAAYTATGFTQVGGATATVDTGGNQGITYTAPSIADVSSLKFQQARVDAMIVLKVSAIVVTSGCSYKIIALASNDPAFGSGNVDMVGELDLGIAASRDGINMITSVIGDYELPVVMQQAGQRYQYLQLYVIVAGSGASITFEAFMARQAKE